MRVMQNGVEVNRASIGAIHSDDGDVTVKLCDRLGRAYELKLNAREAEILAMNLDYQISRFGTLGKSVRRRKSA